VQTQTGTPLKDLPIVPAMTTDAERECYYRLVRENVTEGAVVELGAWLGASTVYMAAGFRDGGGKGAVRVYDKFQSQIGHAEKVRAFYARKGLPDMPQGPCFDQFKANLGELSPFVKAYRGEIGEIEWDDKRIAILVCDAPKRVPAISAVMTRLRRGLQPGSIMAWQDFCHFPSYEIPACLYRLRDHIELVEAVVPGTTLVFQVTSQWDAAEVSPEALALANWTPEEIEEAWTYWTENGVPTSKADLFRCGAAMFLVDIGHPEHGVEQLRRALAGDSAEALSKWRYLRSRRPDFRSRYAVLFELLKDQL
jgi:hypothetical protein